MISEIRTYCKSVVSEVDSDLKQHDEYFDVGNIPDNKLEERYTLLFGAFTNSPQDSSYSGDLAVTLELWKNGTTDTIEKLDTAYDFAIELMSELQCQKRIVNDVFIDRVIGNSVTPNRGESNDNLCKFTLELTVRVSFK